MYALVVEGGEAKSSDGAVIAEEGQKFLVIKDTEGWVEAESIYWNGNFTKDVKTFDTEEEAKEFAQRWEGFPWWCRPNGNFEIIKIRPRYKKVLDGYEVVE